ncbi:MAG TPA: histidine ammonia-lyase [Longimicrobiales bacterium]|nr:histidine ammonia-lyase [Longimicrobiales bacterium]
MTPPLSLSGRNLTLEDVESVARGERHDIELAPSARESVQASRAVVDRVLSEGRTVYGVNTGFGALSDIVIPADDLADLQANLLRSHAAGVGEPLSAEATRAILLLRANTLAAGASGVRPAVIEGLLDLLAHDILPRIPRFGSVGASGDLAPLAHVALALLGEGDVRAGDGWEPAAEALRRAGLRTLAPAAKEGLALINGTQVHTAIGVLALLAAERAVDACDVTGALSLDALRGTPDAFDPAIQEARPHPGQALSAARLRGLLEGSEIRESHRSGDPRVQDAYSLRCMPQVHGASRQLLGYVREVLSVEINSVTDNPLVFARDGRVLSGGNFHGQIVAQALDLIAIACADLGAIAERRIARLVDPSMSGLPAFLTPAPGVRSGLMIVQIGAAALVAEMRRLAVPASVDSIPTDNNKEDHVSMGVGAALKAEQAVALLETVLGMELLAACQALDFLEPLRTGAVAERARSELREVVPRLEDDRVLAPDLDAAAALVREGTLADLARGIAL